MVRPLFGRVRGSIGRLLLVGSVLACSSSAYIAATPEPESAAFHASAPPASQPAVGQHVSDVGPAVPVEEPYSTARWVAEQHAAPRTFVVLGDSLSALAYAPGATEPSTSGTWPLLLAAQDPTLILVNNAGVPSNTTLQMLARLRSDVLDYDPDLLFILGGTNDIGREVPVPTVVDNIRQIVGTAKGRGIAAVLLTVPPINGDYVRRSRARQELNASLTALAAAESILLVDAYSVLATADGRLAAEYAAFDGLHLSLRGEQALADAVYRALHPPRPPARD